MYMSRSEALMKASVHLAAATAPMPESPTRQQDFDNRIAIVTALIAYAAELRHGWMGTY